MAEIIQLQPLPGASGSQSRKHHQGSEITKAASINNSDDQNSYNMILEDGWSYPEGGKQAWLVVLGSFFGLVAVFGVINSVGAVQAYISTNQLAYESESRVSWIFSVFLFLGCLLGLQVGPLFDLYGPYHLCSIGTFIFVGCLILTSFCQNYVQFMLSFGVGAGVGISMLQTPFFAVVGHWFNAKRGTAIGVASVGGSFGGVIFPIVLRSLYTSLGFGWAIRILAFICLGFLLLGIALIKPRVLPQQDHENTQSTAKVLGHHYKDMIRELGSLKDPRFFFLILANFLGESAVLNGLTYLTSYAVAQGKSLQFSYSLLAVLNASGMIGRIVPGFVSDRFGRFNTLIVTVFFAWLTIFAIWLPFGHSSAGLLIFAVLHGFSNGGIMMLGSVCTGQICETKDFGKRYGILYFFTSFGFLLGIPISGSLIRGSDYTYLVIFSGCLYVASMLSVLLARHFCVGFRLCKV